MSTNSFEELAEKTTHDLYNKKISLDIETKVKRIKEFHRMITKFEKKREAKCSRILFESTLLPQYIRLKTVRLSRMFKWLLLNWKSYSRAFPEIPDFEQARKETNDNTLVNTWDEKTFVNKERPKEELSNAFRDVLSTLPKKPVDSIKKHSQVALMRRMEAQGKVYSATHGEWIDKSKKDSVVGHVIDPGETLKRYDSERMKV